MTTPSDPGLSAIMSERRQLIGLAYRLLGSLADAEDVVQETYARWYALSRRHPDLFLLLFTRPTVTPEARRPRNAVQAILRDAGVPGPVVAPLQRLLDTLAMGLAASEAGGRFTTDAEGVEQVYALAEEIVLNAVERYASQ